MTQPHREELSPSPKRLDSDPVWFFPALAYCMMGMDRSLFALFSLGLGRDVAVTTHQASRPIAQMSSVIVTDYPWFGILQGIDRELGEAFIEYIETFRFTESGETPVEWKLVGKSARVADPFVTEEFRIGVDMIFLLPVNLTRRKQVVITRAPGLQLLDPVLGVRPMEPQR